MDKRYNVEILTVKNENKTHTTLEIKNIFDVQPGQFFMLTDYEHGEKPFSVSRVTPETISFTIKDVGECSHALTTKSAGDLLYLRGPYGNGFDIEALSGKKVLFLGGGCGAGPLRSLIEYLPKGTEMTFINGARDNGDLLFHNELESVVSHLYYATDDGSCGTAGNVIDACKNSVDLKGFDYIVVSGPEPMLKGVMEYLSDNSTPAFYLIERYMKCAVGICGQCCVDPVGVRVCVEGPVFTGEMLAGLEEFGSYKRDASGIRHDFRGNRV